MQLRYFAVVLIVFIVVEGRRRETEVQEDFEFIEDTKEKPHDKGSLVWISDPNNELCSLLRCGADELCLLQDRFTAVCVSKHEAKLYGDQIVPAKETKPIETKPEFKPRDFSEDDYDDDDEYLLNDEDDDDLDDFESDDDTKAETDVPKLIRRPFARKQCPTCPVVRPVFLCGSDNKTYSSLCRLHLHNCLHDAKVRISCKGFCPCKDINSHQIRKEKQKQRMKAYMKKLHATEARKSNLKTYPTQSDHTHADFTITDRPTLTDSHRNYHASKHPYRNKHKKSSKYFDEKRSRVKFPSRFDKASHKTYNKYWSKKHDWPDTRSNDVHSEAANSVWGTNECSQEALEAMGNRMLDWFSVIMADSRRKNASPSPGPNWCKKEVSWMLGHLDQDRDSRLNAKELYRLEHDDRERCIKPFIDRCDLDRDLFLSAREWCKCFDRAQRPCAALRKASKGLLGGYIPECDGDGYYRPTQCHMSAAMCWCVDKHGVEVPGSRTREAPHCDDVVKGVTTNRIDDDSENDSDDVDRYEGSADIPLDI